MDGVTILVIIGLVILSGLFSGLTLGLLGLDKSDLERKIKAGNKNAKKIYHIRKRGNLLLCTLLLGNVLVNSILAVFMGELSTGVIAVVVSTGLIVIFGEILPQATISRYALVVGAKTVWIVHIFRVLLFPVCFPIAKFLDWILGEEMPTIWSRRELEEIITTRLKNIFKLIENHLTKIDRNELLPAGIIISGGGSGITTINDLAKAFLRLPARNASLYFLNSNKEKIQDSTWAVACGLCFAGSNLAEKPLSTSEIAKNIKDKMKKWIKQFFV